MNNQEKTIQVVMKETKIDIKKTTFDYLQSKYKKEDFQVLKFPEYLSVALITTALFYINRLADEQKLIDEINAESV